MEYLNACGCTNFDCNTATVNSGGDEYQGNDLTSNSIENSSWWVLQAGNTCTYSLRVCANDCSGGGSPGAQVWVYRTDGPLPSGTITSYVSNNSFFNGCIDISLSVVAGSYYYILLDGNAGASCNVDVTLNLGTCPSCVLLEDDKYTHFRADLAKDNASVTLKWNNLDQKETYYFIERSYDGLNYEPVTSFTSSALTNQYIDRTANFSSKEIYYRLSKDLAGQKNAIDVDVVNIKSKNVKQVRIYDVFGKQYSENNLPSGVVIYVTELEDGTFETRKEYNTK